MAVCQNLVPLVNIKIAGKWMFIHLKMVLIGIDPYPYQLGHISTEIPMAHGHLFKSWNPGATSSTSAAIFMSRPWGLESLSLAAADQLEGSLFQPLDAGHFWISCCKHVYYNIYVLYIYYNIYIYVLYIYYNIYVLYMYYIYYILYILYIYIYIIYYILYIYYIIYIFLYIYTSFSIYIISYCMDDISCVINCNHM